MKKLATVLAFALILLSPAYAIDAQSGGRIILLDNFGEFEKGDYVFLYGSISSISPESFLILKVTNPNGDLCQIQQLTPLSNGLFITESIPLQGRVCGLSGEYEVKVFYGDDSAEGKFNVSSQRYQEPSSVEKFNSAESILTEKIQSVGDVTGSSTLFYSETLDSIKSGSQSVEDLEQLYVDLWDDFFIEDQLFEIDTKFRPAITSALETTSSLVESNKLDFDGAKKIDRETYAAIFYSHLADTRNAVSKLNDVFVQIKNVDPIKIPEKTSLDYRELEDALLNIMTKSQSVMNRDLKEEIALIFARGTGPLYADELDQMLDVLTKTRYLDVILRNNNSLYRLVNTEWESAKSTLLNQSTLEDFLSQIDRVDRIHGAALLLRELDDVDRFISSDRKENSELANLLLPKWEDLEIRLELAASTGDILNSRAEIIDMRNVIDASSRISKAIEILKASNVNSATIDDWESLLIEVENASSVDEILQTVSAFDKSITDMRAKRNPLSVLKFEYEKMRAQAELQADYNNLFMIDNALRIIDTAEKMADGNPKVSKIDQIEVLLTWASAKAPEIREHLNSYSKDVYKVRASDILQRAKSIENLVELSLRTKKFLPGYLEFSDSMNARVDEARALVIKNDLDAADNLVRALFDEWQNVSEAYVEDPYGSDVGYSGDELIRIQYRDKLDALSNTVSNFYNADFAEYSDEFIKMSDETSELIDFGNFVDADKKIREMTDYLGKHLVLNNDKIIYNISYNGEQNIWVLEGSVDKSEKTRKRENREDLYVSVYDMSGKMLSQLEFTDTKHGDFFTQWHAPTEPGLYIVMLQYQNSNASQIVHIPDRTEYTPSVQELDGATQSRDFDELRSFIEEFGGKNFKANSERFDPVINDIKRALSERDSVEVDEKLDDLKRLIERYLPIRSRSAVVEATVDGDQIFISGAVRKTLSFSEDIYVDIFDQQGNHVEEIALKDSSSGHFNELVSIPLQPGVYVVQLEYHDVIVTDFFQID